MFRLFFGTRLTGFELSANAMQRLIPVCEAHGKVSEEKIREFSRKIFIF